MLGRLARFTFHSLLFVTTCIIGCTLVAQERKALSERKKKGKK